MTNSAPKNASKDLVILAEEGRLLLQYVARHGDLKVSPDIVKGIAAVCAKIEQKNWEIADEVELVHCYDMLARQVYPVTVESIKAVVPNINDAKAPPPSASKTISWYRRYTVFTLLLLLILQMFYLFGYNLTQALATQPQPIAGPLPIDIEAHYLLLKKWNQFWMFGQPLHFGEQTQQNSAEHTFSLEFSAHLITAQACLHMLQSYFLPLSYGLLGALIFILRTLLQQVRTLTYTISREVGYRLRLTLGCLAGMITGWFLKPDLGEVSLSPMAFAFLAGYSIEILFTLLDKLIDSIRKQTNVNTPTTNIPPQRPR